jgi:RNA polymerase sigma-70 factor, ECF subfamily
MDWDGEISHSPTDAFERLFLEKYSAIVSILFRLTGDRTRAEELANDAFLKLHSQFSHLREDSNPAGWLYRTTLNIGIDALRANSRRLRYEREAGRQMLQLRRAANPLDEILRAEKRDRVRGILALLRPVQAKVLILRHSGFSYKEVAGILGVALGSVGTMLARAEAEFEERYRELHGSEEES